MLYSLEKVNPRKELMQDTQVVEVVLSLRKTKETVV